MGKSPSPGKGKAAPATSGEKLTKRKADVEKYAEIAHLAAVKPYLLQYSPQIAQAWVFSEDTVLPFLSMCCVQLLVFWQMAQPYLSGKNTYDLVPAIFGCILCFFGGMFPLLISTWEAFRIMGWQGMRKSLLDLWEEGEKAYEAHKKDEEEDKDGDGVPDCQQISSQEVMQRKALLLLKVVNPDKVTTATTSLMHGLLAVLASLKMRFARAITLGASLGSVLQKQVDISITPALTSVVPPEYQKWLPPLTEYCTKGCAVLIAFMLQTIISAFHSAIRGGRLMAMNGGQFLIRKGYVKAEQLDGNKSEMIGYGLSGIGFLFQLYMGFGLPFPFNLLFMPLTIMEYSLGVLVACF